MILFASTLSRNCLLGIACVVCLQAVVPAGWQATLLRLLAVPGALVMMIHVPLAHHRKAALAVSVAALLLAVMLALGFGSSTRYAQSSVGCQLIASLLAVVVLRRLRVLYLTARATAPAAAGFRLASLFVPAYSYSHAQFFKADRAPEKIVARRQRAFAELAESWRLKWPRAAEVAPFVRQHFSDLRFASSNRVYLPFNKVLSEAFEPATVVERADGPAIVDIDGQRLLDASGSYGVNVCGYRRYQQFLQDGMKAAAPLGCVLGPISTVTLDNVRVRASRAAGRARAACAAAWMHRRPPRGLRAATRLGCARPRCRCALERASWRAPPSEAWLPHPPSRLAPDHSPRPPRAPALSRRCSASPASRRSRST